MHMQSQRECGKSSLIKTIFKADLSVCILSSLHLCLTNSCALQILSNHQLMYPGELPSFVHLTTVTLYCMSVRHLDPEKCEPLRTLSRVAQNRRDCTLFGRYAILTVFYGADGELRICIPMSDVIHGQVDKGAKTLLDIGGKLTRRDLDVELNG